MTVQAPTPPRPIPIPRRDPSDPPPASDIAAALVRIEGSLSTLVADQKQANLRATAIENKVDGLSERVDHLEGRTIATDAATKQPSTHDLSAQAQLAQEREAREALAVAHAETASKVEALVISQAKQTAMIAENTAATLAIKNAVVGVVTNKKLAIIGKALFVIAAGYLAGHGTGVLP